MHFDDRLATVLRQAVAGETIARIQYRQLLDLLGSSSNDSQNPQIDAAYLQLNKLSESIPAGLRVKMLSESVLRLRNPRLVAHLSEQEPAVATSALSAAQLDDDQWRDLIPALPLRARAFVRQRRDIGQGAKDILERLGIADRGLPPARDALELDVMLETGEAATCVVEPDEFPQIERADSLTGTEDAGGVVKNADKPAIAEPAPIAHREMDRREHGEAIGAIVRRIEEFRRARKREESAPVPEVADLSAPRLPLGDIMETGDVAGPAAFDFATDRDIRIVWCDSAYAPCAVGLRLAPREADAPVAAPPGMLRSAARRQPIRAAAVSIEGAPRIAGEWQVDASPHFDRPGGNFTGYLGRMRRVAAKASEERDAESANGTADRMRQILHELRTPVSAIQGFAEVIQQSLFGPVPHEYRALAASIASDGAHILAGFEELDRLAKLDSGTLALEAGTCDLREVVSRIVSQLGAYTEARASGFQLIFPEADADLTLTIAQIEAERLVWRILATLASASAPGEALKLRIRRNNGMVRLSVRLPASLADRDDQELFNATLSSQSRALSAGMFGTGFTLRLAKAEAQAAGGALERRGMKLRLELPSQTLSDAINSDESIFGQKPEVTG